MSWTWTATGEKERDGGYHIEEIKALRDETKIGETIKFRSNRYYEIAISGLVGKPRVIEGKVIAKYPHVFELDNGETHTWVDYIMGRQM